MNSSKFEAIFLFTNCLRRLKFIVFPIVFLLLISFPQCAGASISVTLQLESTSTPETAGHKVYVRQEGEDYDFNKPAWQGSENICTLSGLEVDTTYYFVARTYDEFGNTSDNSNEIVFHPSEDDASVPNQDDGTGSSDGSSQNSQKKDPKTGSFIHADALDPTGLEQGQLASTQWQIFRADDDLCVFDVTLTPATFELQVPRLILEKDTPYYYTVRYVANSDQPLEWSPRQNFVESNALPEDLNGDGIPDDQEVDPDLDLDNNGTPDLIQKDIRCIKSADGDKNIGIWFNNTQNGITVTALESISVEEIPIPEDINVAPKMPVGLINLKILVNQPGDTARFSVFVPKSSYDPERLWWFSYDNIHGWKDFSTSAKFGSTGKAIVLKIKDGGEGDADGVANGIIVSQSGPATSPATGIGGGGSSRACFIDTLF